MKLKKFSDPFLHSLFKAVLVYDAEEIKGLIKKRIGGKLMAEWELTGVYEEMLSSRTYKMKQKKIDVLWVLEHPTRELGERRVLHEVKTGMFDLVKTIKSYRSCYFGHDLYSHAVTTNHPLYIWNWKLKGNRLGGAVELVPLTWLLPFVERRLADIFV